MFRPSANDIGVNGIRRFFRLDDNFFVRQIRSVWARWLVNYPYSRINRANGVGQW